MNFRFLLYGFVLFTLICSACSLVSHPKDGIYLIPKGYKGDVILFFNQPDGIVPEVENGLYVYKIPKDGILRVRTPSTSGIVDVHYYYIDENDERQEIKYLRITGDRNPSGEPQNKFSNINENEYENSVFIMSSGGLGSFNTKNGIVQFTNFIVGTPKESEILYNKMQKRISDYQREFTR